MGFALSANLCTKKILFIKRCRLLLTWSDDDGRGLVVDGDGPVVGRQSEPLPVHHVHSPVR